jgi:hypothetical protein
MVLKVRSTPQPIPYALDCQDGIGVESADFPRSLAAAVLLLLV